MNNPHSDYVIHADMVAHSLTEDEAQMEILRIHDSEYLRLLGGMQNRNPIMSSLSFYGWLQEHYPELLDFPDTGDRYQTVTCWVQAWDRGELN